MRYFKYFILFILSLILIVAVLLNTSAGLKSLIYIAELIIPLQIEKHSIEGNIISGFELKNIKYKTDTFQFNVGGFKFDWLPSQLITKHQVIITLLSLKNVDITAISSKDTVNTDASSSNSKLLHYLHYIRLYHLVIENLNILYDQTSLKFNLIQFIPHSSSQYAITIVLPKGRLTGTANLYENSAYHGTIQLKASGINLSQTPLNNLSDLNFHLSIQGQFSEEKYQAEIALTNLSGRYQSYPFHGLSEITFTKDKINVDNLNFTLGNMSLYAKGILTENNPDFIFNLTIPNISVFSSQLKGAITAKGNLKTLSNQPKLTANFSAKNIAYKEYKISTITGQVLSDMKSYALINLSTPRITDANVSIKNINLNIKSNIKNQKLISQANLTFNKTNQLSFNLEKIDLTKSLNEQTPISGILKLNVKDFSPLQIKEVRNLQGNLLGQIAINGTLANLKAKGNAQLNLHNLFIAALGIRPVAHINLLLDYPRKIKIEGTIKSGNGQINLSTNLNIPNYYPLTIKAKGAHFTALDLTDYHLILSPDLTVTLHPDKNNLSGTLSIDKLNINGDHYQQLITLPTETIIVDHQRPRALPAELVMAIKLKLGNDIFISYKGLKARLVGELNVVKIAGGLPTGSGIIEIKQGEYRIYNTYLKIEEGRLIYSANLLANPVLDVTVKKKITPPPTSANQFPTYGEAYVGAQLSGTLDEPVFNFISNPAMDQSDILSYLILNSSSTQLGGSQTALLSSVASQLNIFNTDTLNNSMFAPLANFISTSTFSNGPSFNFRYKLTPSWWIQTQASTMDTNVDLVYAIEHD